MLILMVILDRKFLTDNLVESIVFDSAPRSSRDSNLLYFFSYRIRSFSSS